MCQDTILVTGNFSAGKPTGEGSVVVSKEGDTVLGIIIETFGPTQKPFYAVRYFNCLFLKCIHKLLLSCSG